MFYLASVRYLMYLRLYMFSMLFSPFLILMAGYNPDEGMSGSSMRRGVCYVLIL